MREAWIARPCIPRPTCPMIAPEIVQMTPITMRRTPPTVVIPAATSTTPRTAPTMPPPASPFETATNCFALAALPDACLLPSVVRWSQPGQGFGAQFESLRAVEVRGLNRLLHDLAPVQGEAP